MLSFVLTRKGRVSRHNFHPLRSKSWLKRRQISAGSSLRAGSPQCFLCRLPLLSGCRGRDGEGFFAALRSGLSHWVALARAVESGRTQPPAVPCGPPVPPHWLQSDSLRPHESQHARSPCPSPSSGVHWDSWSSSQWCHPAISSSVVPFSCPNPSQHKSLFQWVNSLHEVAKVLEFQL